MAERKHRILKELYTSSPKISKPKITPVLLGTYCIQGPQEEWSLDFGANKRTPEGESILANHLPYTHLDTEDLQVCPTPSSSSTQPASDVELRIGDEMSDVNYKKDVARRGFVGGASESLLNSSSDDRLQANDTADLVSGYLSNGSLSEIEDNRGIVHISDASTSHPSDESKLLALEHEGDNQDDSYKKRLSPIGDISGGQVTGCSSHEKQEAQRNIKDTGNLSLKSFMSESLSPKDNQMQNDSPDKSPAYCNSSRGLVIDSSGSKDCEKSTSSKHKQDVFDSLVEHAESSSGSSGLINSIEGVKLDAKVSAELPVDLVRPVGPDRSNFSAGESVKICPLSEAEYVTIHDTAKGIVSSAEPDLKNVVVSSNVPVDGSVVLDETNEKHVSSQALNNEKLSSMKQLPDGELSDSETDVKVCDICGDAGREDSLAVCARCTDGAEHIYCMKKMLAKLPEGDWICEECQLALDMESHKFDKSETGVPALNICTIDIKDKALRGIKGLKESSQLGIKVPEDKATTPGLTRMTSAKSHAGEMEMISLSKQQGSQGNSASYSLGSPNKKPMFSRKGLSKDLDTSKTKPLHVPPLSAIQNTDNDDVGTSRRNITGPDQKVLSRLQLPRKVTKVASISHKASVLLESKNASPRSPNQVTKNRAASVVASPKPLTKSSNLHSLKPKPKVKQIPAQPLQKQVTNKDTSCGDSKKDLSTRAFSRSFSLKSNMRGGSFNSNDVRSTMKLQNQRLGENAKGKQSREVPNMIKKAHSFKQDRCGIPLSSSTAGNISLTRSDSKKTFEGQPDLSSKTSKPLSTEPFESNKAASNGMAQRKRPAPHHDNETASVSKFVKGVQLDEKPKAFKNSCGGTRLGEPENSATPIGNDDRNQQLLALSDLETGKIGNELQFPVIPPADSNGKLIGALVMEKVDQNCSFWTSKGDKFSTAVTAEKPGLTSERMKLRESTSSEKMAKKGPSLWPKSFSTNSRSIRCFKCNELGHIAQYCSSRGTDAGNSSRDYGSFSSSPRELTRKSKWPVDSFISKPMKAPENDKPACISNDANIVDMDMNCERMLKDPDPKFPGRAFDSNVNIDAAVSINGLSSEKTGNPHEFSRSSHGISICTYGNSSGLNLTDMYVQPSPPVRPKVPAIPEQDYIWQGSLEILKSGNSVELCSGVQAYVSTCAKPEVYEAARSFPFSIHLEEACRLEFWPITFQIEPEEDDIALYFFAEDIESYEKHYKKLVDNMVLHDLVLKTQFNEVEFLIYASNQLPDKSQRWNKLFFLWGVFREPRSNWPPQENVISNEISYTSMSTELADGRAEAFARGKWHPDKALHMDSSFCISDSDANGGNRSALSSSIQGSIFQPNQELNFSVNEDTKPFNNRNLSRNDRFFREKFPSSISQIQSLENLEELDCRNPSNASSKMLRGYEGGNTLRGSRTPLELGDSNGWKDVLKPYASNSNQSITGSLPVPKAINASSRSVNFRECSHDAELNLNKEKPTDLSSKTTSKISEVERAGVKQGVAEDEVERTAVVKQETVSFELNSNQKRPFSRSSPGTSQTLQSRIGVSEIRGNDVKVEKIEAMPEDAEQQACKRLKQSVMPNSFALCDLNESCSTEEFVARDNEVAAEAATSERCFFPSNSEQICGLGIQNDPGPSRRDTPNLELALGGRGSSWSKHDGIPFLVDLLDMNSEGGADPSNDIGTSSLSLSLEYPESDRERTCRPVPTTEKPVPKKSQGNTPLVLFGSRLNP